MNRKDFFKKLGLGALVVVVAPKVFAETPPPYDLREIERTNILVPHITDELQVTYEEYQDEMDYIVSRRINDAIWELKFD